MTTEEINTRFDELEAMCNEDERHDLAEQLRQWIYTLTAERDALAAKLATAEGDLTDALMENVALELKLRKALLVEPVGEECRADTLDLCEYFTWNRPGVWELFENTLSGYRVFQIDGDGDTEIADEAIVQPVRLVPGKEASHANDSD